MQKQWDYALLTLRMDKIYVIGKKKDKPLSKIFHDCIMISGIADLPKTTPLIIINPENGRYVQGVTSLVDFTHPASAIYLFGSDEGFLSPNNLKGHSIKDKVYIPAETDDQMFSYMAFAVVMWDRKMKRG